MRTVLFTVMPDEEDESKFVIARKDPKTGELFPSRRDGNKGLREKKRSTAPGRPCEGVRDPPLIDDDIRPS